MKLSVVILNYNVRYFLELCLQSVLAATELIQAEIIVVDNKSSDDSCAMIKSNYPSVRLVENNNNLGFSKGNNIGVSYAKGEFLCILNPDTVVAEDTFIKLLDFAKTKQNLGIIGCQLIDGTGKFLPESKRNIPYPNVALKKLLGNDKGYYTQDINIESNGEVEILVGAFMFMKREVYETIGGLDEDYFMYGEDIDLSYKALKAGYQNYYFGETSVIHFKGESTSKDEKYFRRFYGAMQIFYRKHFSRNFILNAIVWLALKFISKNKQTVNSAKPEYEDIILFSKANKDIKLDQKGKSLNVKSHLGEDVNENSLVVYDADSFKFGHIIKDMKQKSLKYSVAYRFMPKNSTFILGSDSANERGEILWC